MISMPQNEIVRDYAPGSAERAEIVAEIRSQLATRPNISSSVQEDSVDPLPPAHVTAPHAHRLVLADLQFATPKTVEASIQTAMLTAKEWARTSWEERASIFLKAADLVSGPWRATLNAATMLGQSKTVYQAEIDAAAEFADFLRFNVTFAEQIYADQPISGKNNWNRSDYRPLEGFVYAVTPFNFTAIAGNLPTAPALMGNVVIWKPSNASALSSYHITKLLEAAGLPKGVINVVYGDPAQITAQVLQCPHFAGLHFTGSTEVFNGLWQMVSANLSGFRSYPRLVGETGGKNFVLAHPSCDTDVLVTAITRGGYEYQGQKCSAASRIYVPTTVWKTIKSRLVSDIEALQYGDVTDLTSFMGAVIDARAFDRHRQAIETAKKDSNCTLLAGGVCDDHDGYFVSPTLFEVHDDNNPLLKQELFGPIVGVRVFEDSAFDDMIAYIDRTSVYGLTGSIFATDRSAITRATHGLRFAAGNFYINDKPTGAVVGQQPFGGARSSGTNDKAGSMWNLMRWVSPRTIKENFCPPKDFKYPSMLEAV
jgi:1-pyrroline-5-carboxylate dehydrogenase